MPQTSQNVIPLSRELGRLESLPQAVVAYGRDLADGEVLPFHRHRRAICVAARRDFAMTRKGGFDG